MTDFDDKTKAASEKFTENNLEHRYIKQDAFEVGANFAKDILQGELKSQKKHYEKMFNQAYSHDECQTKYEALKEKLRLVRSNALVIIEVLSQYASGRRDDSFEGWEYDWRETEIKQDSDYAFYPNHVTKEFIEEIKSKIKEVSE